ncbi:MAG TPA: hypothetical protein VMT87_14190 [Vicinamibacteria bacterium]|nr:hypothetical protein [Vicinamibacteria bacterium]
MKPSRRAQTVDGLHQRAGGRRRMLMRRAARAAVLAALAPVIGGAAETGRVRQYLGLARATLERPIAPAELDAAVLSAQGIEAVAALFESSLAAGVTMDGAVVTPELGGEATLDAGRLTFVVYPDPVHPVVRRMLELKDDPAGLLDHLSRSAEGAHVLKTSGGLHALLYQMTTRPPAEAQRRALDVVLRHAVATHFKTWTVSPEIQRDMIEKHDWRGRYVGLWHLHPPRPDGATWAAGLEPGLEDMTVAAEKGQFLTIVFQPDGFDAYDLSAVAASGRLDVSKARRVSHRSADWERRFRVR